MSEPQPRQVRGTTPAHVYQLGSEPAADLSATTTASERIEMVAVLTRRAWELTGRPWPRLRRSEWPVTIVRRGD